MFTYLLDIGTLRTLCPYKGEMDSLITYLLIVYADSDGFERWITLKTLHLDWFIPAMAI